MNIHGRGYLYYEGNHRDFQDQRHRRKHGDYYEDTYDKNKHRTSYKNKGRNKNRDQNKDQYRDDSYDKNRGRSKGYLDDNDIFSSEIERVHKILQMRSQEKELAIRFMLVFSENPDKILDSIHSPADVDCLIAERVDYSKCQEPESLTKDPLVYVSNTSSQNFMKPVNYEPIEVQSQSVGENITVDSQDELDLWELVEIPDTPTRLAEGKILEEFVLEGEIEFQGIDKCKIVELQDEQDIERWIASETVGLPEIPVRIAYDQEECIEEEICDMSLPEMYSAEESIHTDKLRLETPIINEVEINEIPREVKLEIPIEQSESKLVQNVTLLSNVPTPSQNYHQPLMKQEITLPNRNITQSMTKGEILVPNRNIPGK